MISPSRWRVRCRLSLERPPPPEPQRDGDARCAASQASICSASAGCPPARARPRACSAAASAAVVASVSLEGARVGARAASAAPTAASSSVRANAFERRGERALEEHVELQHRPDDAACARGLAVPCRPPVVGEQVDRRRLALGVGARTRPALRVDVQVAVPRRAARRPASWYAETEKSSHSARNSR